MQIDLTYDELTLLIQLLNQHIVKLQGEPNRKEVEIEKGVFTSTPFEATLLAKLMSGHR